MAKSLVKRLFGWVDSPSDRWSGRPPAREPVLAASASSPPAMPDLAVETADARRIALRKAFTPTHPLRSTRRLAGRRTQLARILRAVLEQSAHVVIYGERGRGKTSLTNLVSLALRALGAMVATHTCTSEDEFDVVLRGLMRSLPRSLLGAPAQRGEDRLAGCEAALPTGRLQPADVLGLSSRLTGQRLVLVVDEFDRISDVTTRTRLADTIKLLSDRAAPILFVIVGVSENLEELLGRHPSIQRNIVGVPLPLLTDTEIKALIERGAQDAGLVFPAEARSSIAAFARGVPYVAQLLALHAGYSVLSRGSLEVAGADLEAALQMAVAESDPRVVRLYETLTEGGRDAEMEVFLQALASGPQDAFGRFVVEPVGAGVVSVGGRVAPASLWHRLVEAGVVRRCSDAGPHLYAMVEATFINYVLMRTACNGPVPHAMALDVQTSGVI